MIKKTVIISCAGMGTRLGLNVPKCLVEINGKTLLEIQLQQLEDVEDVRIVVGYKKNLVLDKLAELNANVKIYENNNYQNTGTAASFCTAIDETVNDYVIALDGDLIVNSIDMETILNSDEELICGEKINTENPVLISVDKLGNVTEFSREKGDFEWAGLAQIHKSNLLNGTKHVYQLLEPLLPKKFQLIRAKEIDTPNDLEEAKLWMKINFFTEKDIIQNWFQSRFSIDDNYLVSRYSINDRAKYDIDLIKNYINQESLVLDLGCGTGILEEKLEKFVKHIKAIDRYQEFLDKAKISLKIEYEKHDITTYKDQRKYDLIMMFGVTMYLLEEELNDVLKNCIDMMHDNSVFIIKNQWSIEQTDYIVNKEYSDKNKNQYYGIYRSLHNMKKILSSYNLSYQLIDIYPSEMNKYENTHEYAIVCKKKI
ncbi:MAG: NTP transferase domain-containing protein [bacterium]|nr:NTP transferase domain-containing protein [bacterium]